MNTPTRSLVAAACLATALYAPMGAAGSVKQDLIDARQESQIWTTYGFNRNLRALDLKVEVHTGRATLTGKVGEGVEKALAEQIALGVSGIKSVDNQIVVEADYMPPPRASKDRSFGEVVDDASITAAVKSKLLWSRYADGLTTDVDTMRGAVSLTGTADSSAAKDLAGRLALNTNGVNSVSNKLVVKADKPGMGEKASQKTADARQGVSDTWITAKVKSTFLYSRYVDGTDIKVETKDGAVTLTGRVDTGAERDLAIELAQNVRGVTTVDAKGLKV